MTAQPVAAPVKVRPLHPGMGQAVAERTVLRPRLAAEGAGKAEARITISPADKNYFDWLRAAYYTPGVEIVDDYSAPARGKPKTEYETWGQVALRVALGNTTIVPPEKHGRSNEFMGLKDHIAKATILLSGRHLQHGDIEQPKRNMEVFTNCATAATNFASFGLLLNGSGVGRCYDNAMILVDYDFAPSLRIVLDENHPDFQWGRHESTRDARHKYGKGKSVIWHVVEDSREGWQKAVELYEVLAFQKVHAHKTLILDFSEVRSKGSPIRGMQMRPSSGPVPLMDALLKLASLKGAGLDPWLQAIYADHYLAECVLVGGARRAARMSTKTWRDRNVLDFIEVKRPVEYEGLSNEEVLAFREEWKERFKRGEVFMPNPPAFLWSSNNSVTVDKDFWAYVNMADDVVAAGGWHPAKSVTDDAKHAKKVFKRLVECAYFDGTGEPGIINVDMLATNREGWNYSDGDFLGSKKYQIENDTRVYHSLLAKAAHKMRYPMITNPCGEISLTVLGGYCTIADVVPFHADTLDEAEDAFRHATRALMRVNLMDCMYSREVNRTNRIGVGMTGVHEFAWKFFRVGFRELVGLGRKQIRKIAAGAAAECGTTSTDAIVDLLSRSSLASDRVAAFWLTLSRFSRAVKGEAKAYAALLGVPVPHTDTTIKPAGTTSKLFGLTEGWHLPPFAEYLRWVQFKDNDPLVAEYKAKGYPIRDGLKQYAGMVIVGFPTVPTIATLGMGDALVLAGDATPEEQYRWLMLGEHFYIRGVSEDGEPLAETGNQISYTLKYKPELVSFEDFRATLLGYQSKVRACSVMPQEDGSAYEYLPEESVTKAEFEAIARAIQAPVKEDINFAHLDCGTGGCPVDFTEEKAS